MIEVKDERNLQEYIDSLLVRKEADDLEFKSAAGGFPKSFWDTYSAFANTGGGTIILGVAEKKDGTYLDNLSDEQIDKYQKDFWSGANNRGTISRNLLTKDDVIVGNYKGHKLLLFYIPRAKPELRPVYRTYQPYSGTYKRNYEGDYLCSPDEVRRMFADADMKEPADGHILEGFTMDDLDKETLKQYRQLFRSAKPDHPWLVLDDKELLQKLGGYRLDRKSGREGLTVAGLLMFGKYEAITDPNCAPHFFPDYRERFTEDPNVRWTNRLCPDGTWEANLFQFYIRVLPRLQSSLPKPFKLKGSIRIDETPAHVAVREALVNLCIHADYTENLTQIVLQESNKFVFSNPGTLLISKEQYYQGGESVCRNKSLQKMFMMLGTAEKAGSGVDKILHGWQEANWRKPILDEKVQPDHVVLTMPMVSLIDDDTKGKLVNLFGPNIVNISHNALITLSLACTEGYVTHERLRYSLQLHKQGISELLHNLCENGLLVSYGKGRGTKYRLPDSYGNLFTQKVASSSEKVASSDGKVASSSEKVASSGGKVASSGGKVASSKQRLRRKDLEELICQVCRNWISLDEMAEMAGRNYNYLRNRILPKMIAEKKIEMMFPTTPRHPRQKYKTKD